MKPLRSVPFPLWCALALLAVVGVACTAVYSDGWMLLTGAVVVAVAVYLAAPAQP